MIIFFIFPSFIFIYICILFLLNCYYNLWLQAGIGPLLTLHPFMQKKGASDSMTPNLQTLLRLIFNYLQIAVNLNFKTTFFQKLCSIK